MKNKTFVSLILVAVVSCGIMSLVDGVIRPNYWVKSAFKIALFLGLPFLLTRVFPTLQFGKLFRFRKKSFFLALGLGAALYALIMAAYRIAGNIFDFSGIAGSLSRNAGVNRDNFLWVSLYISFVNSLLEEFFFRGFLFANLKALRGRSFGYLFSAGAFTVYHVGMISGWFSPLIYALVMAGLMAGGMIFNFLNEKEQTICTSWLVHMFANFAINTIGFWLMG